MDKLKPDKQIIGAISQHQEIVSDLYDEHYEMLFKYAFSILQSEDAAETAIKETFRAVSMDIENLLKSDNTTEWLVRALQRSIIGDLYNEHYEMLFNYAYSVLRNEDTTEEVIQETFRVACANINKFLESKNKKGWLVRTLQFSIKRFIRQKQTMSKYIARLPDDFDFNNIADERLPDDDVDMLYEDLAQHKDFELLKEFSVNDRPIKEIAEKRNLSIDACTKRLSRIKKKFRDIINKNKE